MRTWRSLQASKMFFGKKARPRLIAAPLSFFGLELLARAAGLHTVARFANLKRCLLAMETDAGQCIRAAAILAGYCSVILGRGLEFDRVRGHRCHNFLALHDVQLDARSRPLD